MRREEMAKGLRERGITPTRQRVALAGILLERPQHVCAEELLRIANQRGARVSKATVYNTLALFVRKGLVREVLVEPTRVYYDSNTSGHHHIFDITTGTLSDLAEDAVAVTRLPELPEGARVESVDVVVRVRSASA